MASIVEGSSGTIGADLGTSWAQFGYRQFFQHLRAPHYRVSEEAATPWSRTMTEPVSASGSIVLELVRSPFHTDAPACTRSPPACSPRRNVPKPWLLRFISSTRTG